MPYKTGKNTKKGWQILKREDDRWKVIGHSKSKEDAQASIRARRAAESNK